MLAGNTLAASYYLSSSSGSDANPGTEGEPWKTLSKASSVNYDPGDSILFKAGDVFFTSPLSLFASDSGIPESPVTVGRYGSGAAPIIYGDHQDVTWASADGHAGVYWIERPGTYANISAVFETNGASYTQKARGTDTTDNWLNTFTNGNWGIEDQLTMRLYIRTLDDGAPDGMHLFEDGAIMLNSVSNIVVEGVDVRNSYHGINMYSANGVTIRSNDVSDAFFSGIFSQHSSHCDIYGNSVHRIGDTLIYLQFGGSNRVHDNILSGSTNQILGVSTTVVGRNPERCGIGLQQGTNNIVERNHISYTEGSFIDYWLEVASVTRYNYGFHGGGAAYPDGTGLRVHNNIFNLDGAGAGIGGGHDHDEELSPAPDAGTNYIYNNTILGFVNYGFFFGQNYTPKVILRNNLFVATSTGVNLINVYSGANVDFNVYFCTEGNPRGWYWNNTRYTILEEFQTASSQDANSIYGDPLFMVSTPTNALDFRLRETSPAVNAGETIGMQPGRDFIGVLIPNGSGPDIGAFEWMARTINATAIRANTVILGQ